MKIRKSLRERYTASTSSRKNTDFDTMGEWHSSRTLPIADEFLRSPTSPTSPQMPPPQPKSGQGDTNGQVPQRRLVPSDMIGASTIRTVPQEDANGTQSSTETSGADDLVSDFSRLSVGNSSCSPEAHGDHEGQPPNTIQRKPLPPLPDDNPSDTDVHDLDRLQSEEFQTWRSFEQSRELERELGVEGQVDLSNTEDVEVVTRYAPAVTRETIIMNSHSVVEEQITREIHQDHIFHRILPVEEVEVLPARHYVPDGKGAFREVSERQLPGRVHKDVQKAVAEAFQNSLPKTSSMAERRKFTAREFSDDEGDYKEYIDPQGVQRSERWWVHPPRLETGGKATGQTYPFYFGSLKPEDDGLRAENSSSNDNTKVGRF